MSTVKRWKIKAHYVAVEFAGYVVVTDDKYEDVVCHGIGVDYRDDAVLIASAPELKAERDRLQEALKKIVALSTPDRVCNNCKHCQELGNTDWCGWNHKLLEDASSQECGKFEAAGFIVPETHTIARKALEGAGDE